MTELFVSFDMSSGRNQTMVALPSASKYSLHLSLTAHGDFRYRALTTVPQDWTRFYDKDAEHYIAGEEGHIERAACNTLW